MTTCLLLADPHAGGRAGENNHLFAVVRRIAEQFDPAQTWCAWLGDLTDDGSQAQIATFTGAMDMLRGAGFVQVATLGNHDVAPDGWREARRETRHEAMCGLVLHGDLDHLSVVPPWVASPHGAPVIVLDTTAGLIGPAHLGDLARGRLGEDQLHALAWHIDQSPAPPWLLMHHHPTYHTHYIAGDNALVDMDALQATIAAHPVELVACGHKHHFERLEIDGARWAVSVPKCTRPTDGKGYPCVAVGHDGGRVESVDLLWL